MEDDKTLIVHSSHQNLRNESQLAEYELQFTDEDLLTMEMKLSEMEMLELENLSKNENENNKPFFKDLLNVVIKGSLDYIDSITDVSETLDSKKQSSKAQQYNEETITKKSKPADPGTEKNWKDRSLNEANKNAFDKNAKMDFQKMTPKGKERLEKYKKAYNQRTKFLTEVSKKNEKNSECLSGLEGYRFGPVIENTPLSELKTQFLKDVNEGNWDKSNISGWIRKHNYAKLDKKIQETFGFKTVSEAEKFRRENNLTPHEGPNGIFLVPSDVHDKVTHEGYVHKVRDFLLGNKNMSEVEKEVRQEKLEHYKHEASERGIRIVKGAMMSYIKDVCIFSIGVVGKETYEVFQNEDGKFIDLVKILFKRVWNKIKIKVIELFKKIKTGILNNFFNEILTAINDFIFKTAKNIFRIIRMMWKSLYEALKTIFSSKSSWGDRLFEASKILAAGTMGVLGLTLNEMIEKGLMSINFPFASVFADILSGLIGGILSAVMLFFFDKIRKNIQENSITLTRVNQSEWLMNIQDAKIMVSVIKTERASDKTLQQFNMNLNEIGNSRKNIIQSIERISRINYDENDDISDDIDNFLKQEF